MSWWKVISSVKMCIFSTEWVKLTQCELLSIFHFKSASSAEKLNRIALNNWPRKHSGELNRRKYLDRRSNSIITRQTIRNWAVKTGVSIKYIQLPDGRNATTWRHSRRQRKCLADSFRLNKWKQFKKMSSTFWQISSTQIKRKIMQAN